MSNHPTSTATTTTTPLPPPTSTTKHHPKPSNKAFELATLTIRNPPYSYVHLILQRSPLPSTTASSAPAPAPAPLDALQLRTYLTAALRRFLGVTGTAIDVDILKVGCDGMTNTGVIGGEAQGKGEADRKGRDNEAWVRVPRDSLSAFAAAVTAWTGTIEEESGRSVTLRVQGAADWLGCLVGRQDEGDLWGVGSSGVDWD